MAALHTLNPLTDGRWTAFVERHPLACVFHTPQWLSALRRTYEYEPLVLTRCQSGTELTSGVAVCGIKGLRGGVRWVSLPFSDHCEPLGASVEDAQDLLQAVAQEAKDLHCRYIEVRPLAAALATSTGFRVSAHFLRHRLTLSGGRSEIFRRLDKGCIQRKICRAERDHLEYEEGRSEELLGKFYRLLLMTRRRQMALPQPLAWFRSLIHCLGENMTIRVASKDGCPLASIITLKFRDKMLFKYGCSDARRHNAGGVPMLLWRAIEEAINLGMSEFDFGRTDLKNESLATFKDRWGATRSPMTYWTSPSVPQGLLRMGASEMARRPLAYFPHWLLALSGRLLYRHAG